MAEEVWATGVPVCVLVGVGVMLVDRGDVGLGCGEEERCDREAGEVVEVRKDLWEALVAVVIRGEV